MMHSHTFAFGKCISENKKGFGTVFDYLYDLMDKGV